MIVPVGAPTFREALRYGAEVFHTLKKLIDARGWPTDRSATKAASRRTCRATSPPLQLLGRAIDKAGYHAGNRHRARVRLRGERVLQGRRYNLESENRALTSEEFANMLGGPGATSTRSSASRTAWRRTTGRGWQLLTERLGKKVQLVGDDVFVTNTKILKQGIAKHVANSILIKNQPDRDADRDVRRGPWRHAPGTRR
jgi:enolase